MLRDIVVIDDDITLISLRGIESNMYLVGKELLIDTGTGSQPAALSHALGKAGVSFDDIRQIVLTHAHFDHIGGVGLFEGATVAAHKIDSAVVESGDGYASEASAFSMSLKPRKVDVKLTNGDLVNSGDIELEVIHTPGHTRGSICLFDAKRGILFSGDTVFADGFGRVDLRGGDMGDMKNSLARLSKLDIKKILPGHGECVLSGGKERIAGILKSV